MTRSLFALLAAASCALACSSDPTPPPAAPAGATEEPTAAAEPTSEKPGDDPQQSNVNISDAIKKACGITDTEAHFAFNSAKVRASDQVVLKKLADCFATGPLKGKQMRIVGHADPRGEPEYNLLLGGRRADNIQGAIAAQGLDAAQMETTSRGELDAQGTDEASWATDRRVDIVLAD